MKHSEFVSSVKFTASRVINKAFSRFSHIFGTESGSITEFRNFLTTIPIKIHYQIMPNEEFEFYLNEGDANALLGGYIVGDEKNLQYYTVNLIIHIPQEPSQELLEKYERFMLGTRVMTNSGMSYIEAILFVYMHEIMHILKKHYTKSVSTMFDAVIKEFEHNNGISIPDGIKHNMKNIACDFYINGYLFSVAREDSSWHAEKNRIERLNQQMQGGKIPEDVRSAVLYHPDFDPVQNKEMTEFDILKKLLENAEISKPNSGSCQCQLGQNQSSAASGSDGKEQEQGQDQSQEQNSSDKGDSSGENNEVESDNNSSDQNQQPSYYDIDIDYKGFKYKYRVYEGQGVKQAGDSQNGSESDVIAEREARNSISQTLRGMGAASIMEQLGLPIEVEVDWLDTLLHLTAAHIKYVQDRQLLSWRKLKNKYRHIAHLPTSIGYENVVDVIISVDQSGSMSDEDIRKINYVILEMLNVVDKVHFIVHDWDIAYYEVFERTSSNEEIRNAVEQVISVRRATGGTSHQYVFKKINEILEEENIEYVYISFSDNYSDIEEKYKSTIVLQDQIFPVWVKTEAGRVLSHEVPGIQINMETGQIINETVEEAHAT